MKTSRKPLTKIQKSARGEDCALRIPGVCNFDSSTVVLCHAPYPGRSGMRGHDWWGVYGCSSCHEVMDFRQQTRYSPVQVGAFWRDAIHETQAKLIKKGLITIGAAA